MIEKTLRKNTFLVLCSIVALMNVVIFWITVVEDRNPDFLLVAFLFSIIFLYGIRRMVRRPSADERSNRINQMAALRTLELFTILFLVISLGSIVWGFNTVMRARDFVPHPFPVITEASAPTEGFQFAGNIGFIQLSLLSLLVLIYAGFRFWYGHKLGEWETNEE